MLEKRHYFYNFVPKSSKKSINIIMRKYILSFFMAFACLCVWGANRPAKAYIFGFASSFNDSTVYFTEIQELDSVYIDSKTKFLYSRENYSGQLREHLQMEGVKAPTCVTCYALKRKDIEKKYARLRKKYAANGNFIVKEVKQPGFRYEAIRDEE